MSYRGRPSKGCESCRARKVKCDEAKPTCTRCIKSGLECKYRDAADLLFRNQTATAAQRAEDSWRKRSKSHQRTQSDTSANSDAASSHSLHSRSETYARSPNDLRGTNLTSHSARPAVTSLTVDESKAPSEVLKNLMIAAPVSSDLRAVAYQRFLYDFAIPETPDKPPEEPSDALLTFVPLLYMEAAPESCLTTIIDAICHINFFNRCQAPEAKAVAEELFGKSIKLLSKAITNEQQVATNHTLASVYLMGMYENLSSFQRRGTFVTHQHGANALLQMRRIEQWCSNPISARLYELIYWQQLLGNLQAAKPPLIPVENVISVRKYIPNMYNSSNTFNIRLIWRTAQLHARWQQTKERAFPPQSRSDLQEILKTALHLDAEFQAWEDTLPPVWGYKVQLNTPEARSKYAPIWQKLILGSNGGPREIYSYSNLKRTWIGGFYRTSRMFLLRDTLEILNWMFRLPERPEIATDMNVTPKPAATKELLAEDEHLPLLDNFTLRAQHSMTTDHLVDIIERSCSAVLSSFTVAIHGKSYEDVCGMRGYVVLWPLGTIDSILSAGLVPSTTDHISPGALPNDSPMATTNGNLEASTPPPVYDPTAAKGHIFDCQPKHPYDHPFDLSKLDISMPSSRRIDVPARREWINRLLCYIGTELGIKKALAVPYMEGYFQIVKPQVDEILGRQN
ncbi:hypothetical protein FB567DRAFT_556095 [Paraphoma chrysanthemicola]|uniref:Zn(2)-C6 fungal-type domain-containing protein n=1 Tax=Paraphoma chrysanthemicola TaxID=798071 RepID=A0A8K0W463_9PLEO|nr:hypothetical protein FB567DRAFT_556095 [Paraphoma chrysanthemicola]